MKTSIIGTLSASLLLISACNSSTPLDIENTVTQKVSLTSGINLTNIDHQVRPQDNFYRYVNGAWLNKTEIPADKTSIGAFYELRDKADEDVKTIIEQLAQTPTLTDGSNEQKVADLFRAYMDQKNRDSLSLKPIQPILNNIQALSNKQELVAFFGQHQAMGITSPMYVYISVDAKASSQYATHIWQGGLALPDRDYYFNQDQRFIDIRNNYVSHIANVYHLLGMKNGNEAAQTVLALETKLANFHWTKVQSRDSVKRYNKFSINELNNLTTNIDWSAYLGAQQVATQPHIIINQPDFIKGLGKTIDEVSLDDWKTYLTFHTISSFASYLTSELDHENFDFFSKKLTGLKQQKPQWKRGVALVNSTLGEVIGKVYVDRHFKPSAKQRMKILVENLRDAYGSSINKLAWMSDETKKQAHIKLAAFTPKIGYPDQWEDYSTLSIKSDDLVGNIIRSGVVSHQKEVAKLGGPIHTWEWGMTPQTVNAYYNPTVNEIVFPAAILQPPFFNMAADDAVNYGGIGAVIGHEMGHGFDDQGSKYDDKGNLRDWWTKQDLEEFTKRGKNLIAQYNQYEVLDGLHINGELTLGENIGDLSGVTIAYKAYKASLKGKKSPIIDGLTGDQRFFYGFAQVWRNKKVEKSIRNQIATDPHSPGEFRALGALSNMPEFYQAFDVKEGDAMFIVPEKRVEIW
jgi:endothelin-converting enzyme/putative endopeptidase